MQSSSRVLAAILSTLLLLVSSGLQARGLYKWVDENGVTHYSQHRPDDPSSANSAAVEEWVNEMLAHDYVYPISAPGIRNTLYLPMDKDWLTSQANTPDLKIPGRLEVTTENPGFKVLVSMLPNRQGGSSLPVKADLQASVTQMAQMNPSFGRDFEAQAPSLHYSSNDSTVVVWFTLKDSRYNDQEPPPGEYRYMTQGTLHASGLVATITILANTTTSSAHRDALTMLKSATAETSEFDRLAGAYKAARAVDQESYARELISKASDKQPETQFLFATLMKNSQEHEHWIELMQRSAGGSYRPALNALIADDNDSSESSGTE